MVRLAARSAVLDAGEGDPGDDPGMVTPVVLLCVVLAVSDGGGLRVRCDADPPVERSLRIGGIDAPDVRQPSGVESRRALVALCQGEQASVVMRRHDAQGRPVADIACRGIDVAAAQTGAGWAWVAETRDAGYPGLEGLQATARAQRRGLWARPQPVPPWEWRRTQARERSA